MIVFALFVPARRNIPGNQRNRRGPFLPLCEVGRDLRLSSEEKRQVGQAPSVRVTGEEAIGIMLTRRDILCQCVGGAGVVVSCVGMIISLAAGLAGAAGSALIQRNGMAGMGSMGGSDQGQAGVSPLLAFFNHIAVPLLLGSIVLMLIGVARAGWRAVGLVAVGSAILLVNMFVQTFAATAAVLLGAGYLLVLLGYMVAWKTTRARRAILSRV